MVKDDLLEQAAEIRARRASSEDAQEYVISPPRIEVVEVGIRGISPYVQNRFSNKAKQMMRDKQASGSRSVKGQKREAKDFKQCYVDAQYFGRCVDDDAESKPWNGIPAACFRNAMIRACSLCGFKMTLGKLSIFIIPDGFDIGAERTPLVRFLKGEPEYVEFAVRNASGVADLRPMALWSPGWEAKLKIQYDGDIFSATDILNLLARAGMQVGIGEGRPSAPKNMGMGHGLFEIIADG
ncbi:MAG: hypothetical protein KatS3mg105_5046 [Gemmatales bacterium]|nr:MAG: hypothetical protein KatS3mg105_5046 [Gemmatales bacterium]